MKPGFLRALCLLTMCAMLSNCSYWNRMGVGKKVILMSAISAAGGVAGAGGAAAAGGAALGISTASAAVNSRYPASTDQKATALRIARQTEATYERSNRRKPRYIAVRTSRSRSSSSSRSSSRPRSSSSSSSSESVGSSSSSETPVMIYDTQTNRLASDQVFTTEKKLTEGSFVEFDNFSTQYVGDGVGNPAPAPKISEPSSSGSTTTGSNE